MPTTGAPRIFSQYCGAACATCASSPQGSQDIFSGTLAALRKTNTYAQAS